MKIIYLSLFLLASCSSSDNLDWSPRDSSAIKRILNDHISEFKKCFPGKIEKDTKVLTYFEVLPTGKVIKSKAESGGHWQTDRCIASIIKDIEFPETEMNGIFRVKQALYFR